MQLLHDLVGDPQPEPGAGAAAAALHERLEQAGHLVLRDPVAVVPDLDLEHLLVRRDAQAHVTALLDGLHGVQGQVQQHLAQRRRRQGQRARQPVVPADPQRLLARVALQQHVHVLDVLRREVVAARAGLDQQRGHGLADLLEPPFEQAHGALGALVRLGEAAERAQRVEHAAERVVDLVRDARGEPSECGESLRDYHLALERLHLVALAHHLGEAALELHDLVRAGDARPLRRRARRSAECLHAL